MRRAVVSNVTFVEILGRYWHDSVKPGTDFQTVSFSHMATELFCTDKPAPKQSSFRTFSPHFAGRFGQKVAISLLNTATFYSSEAEITILHFFVNAISM